MANHSQFRNGVGWSISLGTVMIVLGAIAVAAPIFTSFTAELTLGYLFLVGAVIQGFYAFRADRDNGSFWLKLPLSILYLVVGLLLLANPLAEIISLTLFVGIFFFAGGVFRVLLAFRTKPSPRWGWILINGILLNILGILIWSQWPFNAPSVLGTLVGIGLPVNGLGMIIFGTANQVLNN